MYDQNIAYRLRIRLKSTNTVDSDLVYLRSEHSRRVAKKIPIFLLNSFVSKTQSLVSKLFVFYVTQTVVDVELNVGLQYRSQ